MCQLHETDINAPQASVSTSHSFLRIDGGVSVLYVCTREKHMHTVQTTQMPQGRVKNDILDFVKRINFIFPLCHWLALCHTVAFNMLSPSTSLYTTKYTVNFLYFYGFLYTKGKDRAQTLK